MIRPATTDDVTAIAAIELACFATAAWSESLVRAQVAGERHVTLVDDQLRAYASISVVDEVADLDRIATAPSARGEGLARSLLERLIDQGRDRGAGRMLLEVDASNTPAIGLYESFGFDTISTRRAYYPDGADALVMELTIEEWR
jgi:ribosomal-protein-alanine N-acetyltransferase